MAFCHASLLSKNGIDKGSPKLPCHREEGTSLWRKRGNSVVSTLAKKKMGKQGETLNGFSNQVNKRFNNFPLNLACIELHAEPLFIGPDDLPFDFQSFSMSGIEKNH